MSDKSGIHSGNSRERLPTIEFLDYIPELSDKSGVADISPFVYLTREIPECEAIVLSRDRFMKRFDHVTCYPWKEGILSLFSLEKEGIQRKLT